MTIDTNVFAGIATAERAIEGFKGDAKASVGMANDQKIGAYSLLISSLAGQKLIKGNLPRALSKQVYKGLIEDAGIKEASAKRYLENSVGALRELGIPSQATPEVVREVLKADGIDSENKLAKRVSGTDEKDQMVALAEALVGKFTSRKDEDGQRVQGVFKASKYEQEDWDRFEDAVKELKAARKASSDAAAMAEAAVKTENALANEAFDAL